MPEGAEVVFSWTRLESSQGKELLPTCSSKLSRPKSNSWLPGTAALTPSLLRASTMWLPLVSWLLKLGERASPEKRTTGSV